jgi:hypothetical protein
MKPHVFLSLILVALVSGCATRPPLTADALNSAAQDFRTQVMSDVELPRVVIAVGSLALNQFGIPELQISVDGRGWAALTRAERDRLTWKAAFILSRVMQGWQHAGSGTLSASMVDDLNTRVAWFSALTNGSFQYRLYGP